MSDLDDAMINGISHLAGGGKEPRQMLVYGSDNWIDGIDGWIDGYNKSDKIGR